MVKMRTKQSPCRYQFSNQIPSLLCKLNANAQIIENSWRNCVPSSLVKLSDRMMKSLLQSNLIFLQRNETKLRCARFNRGARDLRKMTLLRVVSRRIRGYVDVLKDSYCWEPIIDSTSDYDVNKTTTVENSSPMTQYMFRNEEPTQYHDYRLQDSTKDFRSGETHSESLLSKHPKEMLQLGQGVIEKSVCVMLDDSASQLKRLRTE